MKKVMILTIVVVSFSAKASNSWPTETVTWKHPSWPTEGIAKYPTEGKTKFTKFPCEPKFPSWPTEPITSWPDC